MQATMRKAATGHMRGISPTFGRNWPGAAACCAAALMVTCMAVSRVRLRRKLRHIPIMKGHLPFVGRVKTVKVR